MAGVQGSGLSAQERTVVSKAISVGRNSAELNLEFQDGGTLEITLDNGRVLLDGEAAGSYTAGDALDAAWRALLSDAVRLDDGPLAGALVAWEPPANLQGEEGALARRIDAHLEEALQRVPAESAQEGAVEIAPSAGPAAGNEEGSLLRILLDQADRLGVLKETLGDLDDVEVHVQEDVTVPAGTTVDRSLLVIQGDARIEGTVRGDVVMIDGDVELREGGEIRGDVRLLDGRLDDEGGRLRGDVVDLTDRDRSLRIDPGVEAEIREQIRREFSRNAPGADVRLTPFLFSPFRGVFRAVGGLLEDILIIFVLSLVGMAVVAMAPRNLDVVSETVRQAPGRAAAVGIAGTILLLPAWILGMVALAVSIVGIPVLIAWIPLFPLAAAAAMVFGYLAVARNMGAWLAGTDSRFTRWIRGSNALYTMAGGIVALMSFYVIADALYVIPFTGFLRGTLVFFGSVVTFLAVEMGFGAVLLTRAGRKPEYPMEHDVDLAWEEAVGSDENAAEGAGSGAHGGMNDEGGRGG
ncbi:MAG: hypothetical protein ACE5GJ_10530 [Gemmatimonadota bacterium]